MYQERGLLPGNLPNQHTGFLDQAILTTLPNWLSTVSTPSIGANPGVVHVWDAADLPLL